MIPPIQYCYVQVGTELVDRLLEHVDNGESFILLGYQGCGKRHVLHLLGRRLEAQMRPHISVFLRDNQTIVTEQDLLVELKERIRTVDAASFIPALAAASSLAEWFHAFASQANGRRIPISFANLETLSDALKQVFLSLVRLAVEESKTMVVGLTGEGILAKTLASSTSPLQCAYQYIVTGHDRETSREFFLKRTSWCGLKFHQKGDKTWTEETAFDAFYSHTGGNLNLLRAILWCLSERRLRFDSDPEKHEGFCRKAVEKSFFHYTSVPLFGLRLFDAAKDILNMEETALITVEKLIDEMAELTPEQKEQPEAWRLPGYEVASASPPTLLELAGFLVRDAQRGVLHFPSAYVADFVCTYFSWGCRGDFWAKQGQWDTAFARYSLINQTEQLRRPRTQRDFNFVRHILNRFYRDLASLITEQNGLHSMEERFAQIGRYILGLSRAMPIRIGQGGQWEATNGTEPVDKDLHVLVDGILNNSPATPVQEGKPPAGQIYFDHARRNMVVVSKPPPEGEDTAKFELTPRHAVLFRLAEGGLAIEQCSWLHRALETLGCVFLTCYNEARIWKRARGSRLRLGEMLQKLFAETTVDESIHALGAYLFDEFKASGVRLLRIDEVTGSLVSMKSWGLNAANQQAFDSGALVVLPDEQPEIWAAIKERKTRVFRWTPPGGKYLRLPQSLSYTEVEHNIYADAVGRKSGDYWIDFPLLVGDQPYGKLTFAFPSHAPPPEAWLSDLEVISKILEQHLIRTQAEVLRKEETRKEQARSAQQRALATIAHDVINRIATLPILLARYKNLQRDVHGTIHDRLSELNARFDTRLDQALSFLEKTKLRLRTAQPRLAEFDLMPLLVEELEPVELDGGTHRLRLIGEEPTTLLPVLADRALLSSVFGELVSNARTMFGGPGKLHLDVDLAFDAPGRSLRITFKDNGPGVPDKDKERIFEHFYTSRPGADAGLGLGLSFVREVIAAHGGTIAEIGICGEGALFEIQLPILPENHEH